LTGYINLFFFLSLSFSRIFSLSSIFFPSLRCALSLSRVANLGLWGCRSGLDVVVEQCDSAVGVVVGLPIWVGCGGLRFGLGFFGAVGVVVGLPIWVGCGGLCFGLGVVVELWVWLWGCRSGLGVVVCVLVSAWWWSRGCGCGVADLGLGVVVCDLVSTWW
jgi:hypothetical protein